MKKIVRKLLKRPVLWAVAASIIIGMCLFLGYAVDDAVHGYIDNLSEGVEEFSVYFVLSVLYGVFIALPFVLTAMNLAFVLFSRKNELVRRSGLKTEMLTLILGTVYTALYSASPIMIRWADWNEPLEEYELHLPVASWTLPTVLTLAALGIAGYLVLRCRNKRILPAVEVSAMAGIYIGTAVAAVWSAQVAKNLFLLSLLPINFILICLKLICETVADGRENGESSEIEGKVQRILMKSANLPWLALPAAILLLVVTISVLMLFGQKPDSIIQAWTQTTGWTLSQPVQ